MGLRDKASKVLGALKERDGRRAASALGEAIDSARVRLMDGVVSRLSGHPVHTDGSSRPQPDLPEADSAAPPAPEVEVKAPASEAPAPAPAAPAPVTAAAAPSPEAPAPAQPAPPSVEPSQATNELPEGYQRDRLVLLARDPTWAFAHWDFSPERLAAAAEGLTDPRALLRFYEVGQDTPLLDADVKAENGRYYLRVPRPDRRYEARLVFVGANGTQKEIARSNDAEPPAMAPRAIDAAPRFVDMQAQTEVLDQREQIYVPPPRIVMNPHRSEVERPSFAPTSPRWAAVMAKVRVRKLAETVAMGGIGTSPGAGVPGPVSSAAPDVRPDLAAAFEAAPSSSAWVRPEPRGWPILTR